jgi:DNA-directed RNA polymerase specialized sigma subunit
MDREEIEDDLPILEFYYDQVIAKLETPTTKAVRKVSRKAIIDLYMKNRDFKATASKLGVSVSTVYQILSRACYAARRVAGLGPRALEDVEDSDE